MKGFRDEYDSYDLEAGCVHGSHIEESVKFLYYREVDPLDALETLGLDLKKIRINPFGFGVNLDKKTLAKKLSKVNVGDNAEYWELLLDLYNNNELRPIIFINNALCDGAHRCILMYALGSLVPVAYFKE